MLKIRPHHILCMRAYQGKGYSEEFNDNMKSVIKSINAYNYFCETTDLNKDNKVEITFNIDSICNKCPNNIDNNLCSSQDKISALDLKVSKYFNIKEGIYSYKDLEEIIYNNITEEIFDDICQNCEWYKIANCKAFIL